MSKAYFMMGGPAAGKSSTIKKLFSDVEVLDCDQFKITHPLYNPKAILPEVHSWSSLECSRAFFAKVSTGEDFVLDSTGTNAEKMVAWINTARAAGYEIHLVYVTCSLSEALKRNAARERNVPEDVVRDKYSTIAVSFEIVSKYADHVEVINNE